MKTNKIGLGVAGVLALATLATFGQGKDDFIRQQAMAEMQRVSGQIDVLQNNFDDLARRVSKLESGGGEARSMRQEIDSLRNTIAELRRQMESQRGEIVRDIFGRIAKMQPATPPPPEKKVVRKVVGPHFEYTVQSGDTLSLVAKAFNTSVSKIKEMNNLKGDGLRVGQKINVPKE